MSEFIRDFNERVRRIDGKHARLKSGYVGKVRPDGLIIFKPPRRRVAIPLHGLAYLFLGFVFFKAVVLAHLGAITYEERVSQLSEGHLIEQVGAAIMWPDPLSHSVARYLVPVLR